MRRLNSCPARYADIAGDRREVLGLGHSDAEDDSDSVGEPDDDDDAASGSDADEDARTPRQYKRLEKEKAAREAAQISDEEDVVAGSDDDDDDDDTTRWGANKKAYYNTNNLEDMSEDSEIDEEEARRMELDEVKKLQARSRRGMEDADFGLGEADVFGGAEAGGKGVKDREKRKRDLDGDADATPSTTKATAASALPLPSDARARAGLLANLQKTSPETVALAGEYADVVDQLIRVESTLKQVQKTQPKHPALGMMHLHYQALYTYVTALTFYFHLRASQRYASRPAELSEHPVLPRLLKLKEGLSAMEDLGFAVPLDGDGDDGSDGDVMEKDEVESDIGDCVGMPGVLAGNVSSEDEDEDEEASVGDLEDDELAGLIADREESQRAVPKKKQKGEKAAPPATTEGKAKRKQTDGKKVNGKGKNVEAPSAPVPVVSPLAGLLDADDSLDLTRRSAGSKKKRGNANSVMANGDGESYGEATSLSNAEQEDKAAKKRSLRFYTGQMDAKEQRRGQAARDRMGGDNDLPYRDRDRSRQAVEQARASREGKLKSASESALDGSEWGDGDAKDWRDVMGMRGGSDGEQKGDAADDDGDDDYYSLVSSGRQSAKRAKKEAHDAERDASRVILDETISDEPGAHRAINRQISTNRGLTPHRKQDRNLRVKKRKKYEKAQKKLSSTRAVYKGGQGALQGGYQGEASGINSSVSKSRRFAS